MQTLVILAPRKGTEATIWHYVARDGKERYLVRHSFESSLPDRTFVLLLDAMAYAADVATNPAYRRYNTITNNLARDYIAA